jgi:hypothetical protein
MQDRHDGKVTMKGIALTKLIHNVIREYGTYDHGSYSVNLSDIDNTDRKLLISHVCDSCDYALAIESSSYLDAMWKENEKYIQSIIEDECYTVYCEDMEEGGAVRCTHPNNDEVYWVRR